MAMEEERVGEEEEEEEEGMDVEGTEEHKLRRGFYST